MNGLNPAYAESVIRKASSGKLTTGQAETHTGPEPSVEEIRFKNKERLETNNPIMTLFTLFIFFYTPLHLFTLLISFPFLFPLPKEIYKERPFPPLLPSFSPSLASLARDIHYSSLRSLSVSYVYTFYVFFFS